MRAAWSRAAPPGLRRLVWRAEFLFRTAVNDAALAGGRLGRFQFIAAHLLLAFEEVLGRRIRLTVPVRLRLGGRTRSFWVADRSELFAVADVLLREEYGALETSRPNVILDLGAHVGSATLYFRERFPNARIIAVEPDVRTLPRLRRNLADLHGVEILKLAVGGQTRRTRFASSPHTSASRIAASGSYEIDVLAFDHLVDLLGIGRIDIVKLDIEGAEFELLESASRLRDVAELVVELHPAHPDAPQDVREWLDGIAERAGMSVAAGSGRSVYVLRRCPYGL